MKKATALTRTLPLLLALLLTLSACQGGGEGTDTTPDTTPGSSPTGTSADTTPDETDPPESQTQGVTDTTPPDDPDEPGKPAVELPAGYTKLLTGDALLGVANENMRSSLKTEGDLTYMHYLTRSATNALYFANTAADLSGIRYVRIKYRTSDDHDGRMYIGSGQTREKSLTVLDWIGDGEWHIMTIDLYSNRCYTEGLTHLRLDPITARGVSTDFAALGLYPDDKATVTPYDPLLGLPALPTDTPDLTGYLTTADGDARYKASGQISGDNGTYTFRDGFKLDVYCRGYFNRYALGYSSTSPIRGTVHYLTWNEKGTPVAASEDFFLEAGENMTFGSLIDGFLDDTYACQITGMTLATCDGSTTTFTVRSISSAAVSVPWDETYYLENDRYKLGVLLSWGGGISYIEDKQDGDDTLGNLINRCDTGRLVQQSYYGIKDGPDYTGGYYGTNLWPYNPVQGGDLKNNSSKLVDFRVNEDGSVYIKCRPMDWAKNAELTPSYMENTYSLENNGIHVNNRFVDFFGVDHNNKRHQELPAFYTVSYLGTFHYYNGTAPWTGDAYETLPNEGFWGGNSNAYHHIAAGNTETWAAWTCPTGYGIGVYTPGAEILLAGRHEYNGSKDPANMGTSYVAPLRTMELESFQPFSYDYYIATGTVDEMRDVFKTQHESEP